MLSCFSAASSICTHRKPSRAPFGIIGAAFIALLDNLIDKSKSWENERNDKKSLRIFPGYVMIVSMFYGIISIIFIKNFINLIYLFTASILVSTIIIFVFLSRLSANDIEFVLRPLERNLHAELKIGRYFLMGNFFIFFAIFLEFFRGLWIFSILCILLLTFINLNLFLFYKYIFCHRPVQIQIPGKINIPNIWSKRFVILNYIVFIGTALIVALIVG